MSGRGNYHIRMSNVYIKDFVIDGNSIVMGHDS